MKKSSLLVMIFMCAVLILTGCKKEEAAAGVNPFDYVELGEYKGVEVTLTSSEVTQEDIDNTIQGVLESRAEYQDAQRPSKSGDKINIDMTGAVDGKKNDGFTSDGFDVYSGYDEYIMAGFEGNLYGLLPGTETVFDVVVPSGFSTVALIGKTVTFTVKINSVQELVTPELTDDVVKEISSYESIDEYKAALKEQLIKTKEQAVIDQKRADAWKKATDNATVLAYPEGSVEEKMKEVENQFAVYAQLKGTTVEEYLQTEVGDTVKGYAENLVKQELVLEAIKKQENIKLSSSEYKEKLPVYAERYNYETEKAFEEKFGKSVIEERMLWEKIQQFVSDEAVVVE